MDRKLAPNSDESLPKSLICCKNVQILLYIYIYIYIFCVSRAAGYILLILVLKYWWKSKKGLKDEKKLKNARNFIVP